MTAPLDAGLGAIGPSNDKHTAMARGLLRGYHARWAGEPWTATAVEREFEVPIWNLHNKGNKPSKSRTFTLAGKWDVLPWRESMFHNSGLWVLDHKTTSSEIHDPDATFWRQLSVGGQPDKYLLAAHYSGLDVTGAIWDAIRKPGIRPKKLAKADQKAVTSFGKYCDVPITEATKQYVLDHGDENGELYEIRVARECTENPERYFQRKPVMRLRNELAQAADELWQLSKEVLTARQTNRHLRNGGACIQFNTPCEFLGICSGYDSPDSNNWQQRGQVHEELDTIQGDGRNVLTHSRLACFQTCRRKHYYRYELGIERIGREPSEALHFGTIMHTGLEAWWSCFLTKEETHGNSDGETAT